MTRPDTVERASQTGPCSILWVENGAGIADSGVSGGSVRVREIAGHWENRDLCEQFIVTTPGGQKLHREMGLRLPTTLLRASLILTREYHRMTRLWSYWITMAHFLAVRGRIDPSATLITASDYFCDVMPAMQLKARNPGTRWIAWVHHREQAPGMRPGAQLVNRVTYRMQTKSFRRIAANADDIWVYDSPAGDVVAQEFRAMGVAEDRIYGMKNGVDGEAISAIPEPAKEVDAIMIGLRPNKGLHDIIPVWQRVQSLRPGTTLRLIGTMNDVEQVLAEIKQLGLDPYIKLALPDDGTPFFFKEKLYEQMKRARIMFAPSREEGWGIAVCEAMACGLPVATYDLPVYRRIYGNSISTVPVADHDALASTICTLLDDADRYTQMQHLGNSRAAAYQWRNLAELDFARMVHVHERCGA